MQLPVLEADSARQDATHSFGPWRGHMANQKARERVEDEGYSLR